jgi:hypothetical protein
MSALFALPKQVPLSSAGLLLPGAKLYFYQTGTTTVQAVYQDVGLSSAHASPVVADAAGVFAAIYLGQFTTNYRVRLETSAGVLLWQLDNIPADSQDAFLDQSNTFTASGNGNPALLFSAAIPNIAWYETDGTANQRRWQIGVNGGVLALAGTNDAANAFADAILLTMGAGPTITSLNLKATSVQSNGVEIATTTSGDFTGTLTGMTGSVTRSIHYVRTGNLVSLSLTTAIGDATGTSNTTAMKLTGLPAAISPTGRISTAFCGYVIDSGTILSVQAQVFNQEVSFFIGFNGTTLFTNSGTKGLNANWSLTYQLS